LQASIWLSVVILISAGTLLIKNSRSHQDEDHANESGPALFWLQPRVDRRLGGECRGNRGFEELSKIIKILPRLATNFSTKPPIINGRGPHAEGGTVLARWTIDQSVQSSVLMKQFHISTQ
jgi:hypothetical protein